MIKLKIEDKLVTVATCGEADVPVVYFNAFENEDVYKRQALSIPTNTLMER